MNVLLAGADDEGRSQGHRVHVGQEPWREFAFSSLSFAFGRLVTGKDSAERRRAIRVPTEIYMEVKLPSVLAAEFYIQ